MAAETSAYQDATEAASGGLPQFAVQYWGGQIFWLFVTFGLLYFILATFILPKLSTGLAERASRIADDIDAATRMQQEAEEAEKAYNHALADAQAQAHNVAETTRKAIDAEITANIESADAEMARNADAAEARVQEMRTAALGNIESIASDIAGDVVTAVTGKTMTAAAIKLAISKG